MLGPWGRNRVAAPRVLPQMKDALSRAIAGVDCVCGSSLQAPVGAANVTRNTGAASSISRGDILKQLAGLTIGNNGKNWNAHWTYWWQPELPNDLHGFHYNTLLHMKIIMNSEWILNDSHWAQIAVGQE